MPNYVKDPDDFVNRRPRGTRGGKVMSASPLEVSSITSEIDTETTIQSLLDSLTNFFPTSKDDPNLGQFEAELRKGLSAIVDKSVRVCLDKVRNDYMTMIDSEQQSRRSMNICIRGVPEEQHQLNPHEREQELEKSVVAVINETVRPSVPISVDSIVRARRVGKFDVPSGSLKPTPRPVIVTLYKHAQRMDIFRHKKNCKGTGYMITEDLTNMRRDILTAAFGKFPAKQVWTANGVIKWNHKNRIYSATTMTDFEEKTKDVPPLPLEQRPRWTQGSKRRSSVRQDDTI